MDTLPLFPLGTVMLPGILLPLRVFEPRYVAMMGQLGRTDEPFGVVAIRRGREVGDPTPELYGVGCRASVRSVTPLGDQLAVEALTGRRFRLHTVHDDRAPYLVGEVSWLEEEGEVPGDLTGRAVEAFSAFTHSVGARVDGLPTNDPHRLTSAILDGLGQPPPELQAVLEAGDAATRLRTVIRMCRREQRLAEVLRCRAARVTPSSRLSPN